MTLRQISWACDHVAEMLLILINLLTTWLIKAKFWIFPSQEKYHDFEKAQSVAETFILMSDVGAVSVWAAMGQFLFQAILVLD